MRRFSHVPDGTVTTRSCVQRTTRDSCYAETEKGRWLLLLALTLPCVGSNSAPTSLEPRWRAAQTRHLPPPTCASSPPWSRRAQPVPRSVNRYSYLSFVALQFNPIASYGSSNLVEEETTDYHARVLHGLRHLLVSHAQLMVEPIRSLSEFRDRSAYLSLSRQIGPPRST
jgi:hypothetical protein